MEIFEGGCLWSLEIIEERLRECGLLLAGKADAALDVSGNLEVFFQIEASCAAMLVGNLVARLVLGREEGTLHCLWRGGLLSLRLLEGEQQDEIDAIMTAPPKTYRRRVKLSWMATGWQRVGSSWYWLDASGAMGIGWLQQSARWYYLKASGAMAVGWQKVGSAWYWFDGSGAMATSQWVGAYYVGADGKWVPGYGQAPVTPASDFEYKVGDFDPREFSSGSANYYPYVELPGYGVYITGYKGSSRTVRLPQKIDGVPVVYADLVHTGDGGILEDVAQIDVGLCSDLKWVEWFSADLVLFGDARSLQVICAQDCPMANLDMSALSDLRVLYTHGFSHPPLSA